MRRHPALQDLSRDHHPALLHARRLRGEDPRVDTGTARRRFLLFNAAVLRFHFGEEDAALVPFIRSAAHRERLAAEHADLRERADRLPGADDAFQSDLGRRLRAHIRWEEDELFETLQRDLTPPEWERLAAVAHEYRLRTRPSADDAEDCYL